MTKQDYMLLVVHAETSESKPVQLETSHSTYMKLPLRVNTDYSAVQ